MHNRPIMGVEIERKFLVAGDAWRRDVTALRTLRQGYLSSGATPAVRIRTDGQTAWLTIKTGGQGVIRAEFEYSIPVSDAEELLKACDGRVIGKVRHIVPHGGHQWEIDVFDGKNAGLVLAEIELDAEHEEFVRPPWIGTEVTGDPRYYNSSLAAQPMAQGG